MQKILHKIFGCRWQIVVDSDESFPNNYYRLVVRVCRVCGKMEYGVSFIQHNRHSPFVWRELDTDQIDGDTAYTDEPVNDV